ncbi:glycosyltransferase family 2 protein [Bifidobacterium sp.]|uniref:glycosyltransferase family 2 protein n=1 Tax=Bifidobacterium sp. TaxID=41200 RepID=UPI0039ED7345
MHDENSHIEISVVIPVYNTDFRLLSSCFESVERQTFQSFEVLVVDDGSTDAETIRECDSIGTNASATVFHTINKGASAARNLGISRARGKWIAFIDADDWVETTYLQKLISSRNEYGEQDIVFCDCMVDYRDHSVPNAFARPSCSREFGSSENRERLLLQLLGQNKYYNPPEIGIGVPWGKLYRRDFLLSHNIEFDTTLKLMEDNVFNLYAFKLAKSIRYIPEYLYHYNNRETSASHRFNPGIIHDFVLVHESTQHFLTTIDPDPVLQQGYYSRVIQSLHPLLRYYFFHSDYPHNRKTAYEEISKLLKQNPFKTAIESVDYSAMPPKMLSYAVLIKLRLLRLLRLIIAKE